MKSTIKKSTYRAIYRLLDRVSPVALDCGTLCGSACCTCNNGAETEINSTDFNGDGDFDMGIYLYPGEETLFSGRGKHFFGNEGALFPSDWLWWSEENAADYDFPDSWHGKIYFVRCKTPPHCPREYRPLQCRFFPLTPHLTEDGTLRLILSPLKLPYKCPLIHQSMELEPRFIRATYTVWTHLLRDPLIWDLVEYDSILREEDGLELHFVPVPLITF